MKVFIPLELLFPPNRLTDGELQVRQREIVPAIQNAVDAYRKRQEEDRARIRAEERKKEQTPYWKMKDEKYGWFHQ